MVTFGDQVPDASYVLLTYPCRHIWGHEKIDAQIQRRKVNNAKKYDGHEDKGNYGEEYSSKKELKQGAHDR